MSIISTHAAESATGAGTKLLTLYFTIVLQSDVYSQVYVKPKVLDMLMQW